MTDHTGMSGVEMFGAPDPGPEYRNHGEEIEATRKAVEDREDDAFNKFWAEFAPCFKVDRHVARFLFLSGWLALERAQRDEFRHAFPGLPE